MKRAFNTRINDYVTIEEASKDISLQSPLICESEGCNAAVSFVTSHKRQYGDKTRIIKAYFKLKNSDNNHDPDKCKFNTHGQLKLIARDSDDILESINNDKYIFRLNLLTNAMRSKNTSISSDSGNEPVPNQNEKKYVNSGKTTSYLSTMKRILRLHTEIENDRELKDLVTLKLGDKEIKWTNFYYETERFRQCFNYVERNGVSHPICLQGRIKSLSDPKDKFPYYTINLAIPWVNKEDDDKVRRIPSVSLVIYNQELVTKIKEKMENGQDEIAVYSHLKINKSDIFEKDNQPKQQFLNIIGSINHEQQVHIF